MKRSASRASEPRGATPRASPTTRVALLRWFDLHARDLPWRRTRDPYAIWLSEVMLQQTRVDTVVPYYQRFLESFPTATALADAPEDTVLSHWSGLGYYRRARQLHAAAKVMRDTHGGSLPPDPDALRALPGIGPYTAGAIGSIAFERREPIVDGNVARVLSRLFGIEAPLGSKGSEAELWAHAAAFADGERPGAINQALMELGATICTPKSAACESCPIASGCIAQKTDRTALLPVPKVRRAPKLVHLVAVHASQGARVWLTQSTGALFGGLWGLPMVEVDDRAAPWRAAVRRALKSVGLEATAALTLAGSLTHVLTHRRLEVRLVRVEARRVEGVEGTARAFTQSALEGVGISTLARRLLALASSSTGATRRGR